MITPGEPYHIEQFTDLCEAHDLVPVPCSGQWVRYPAAGKRWVVMVRVKKRKENDDGSEE